MDPVLKEFLQHQLKELYQHYFYYILAAQLFFGVVIGAIPLMLGVKRQKRNLGLIGFVVSIAVVAISPLISLVAAAIFAFLIARGSRPVEVVVNEKPVDVSVKDEQ